MRCRFPSVLGVLRSAEPQLPDQQSNAEMLRRVAGRLRRQADDLPHVLERIDAYDRLDVWRGGRATVFRRGLLDQASSLVSPWGGAAGELRAAASRLEARAAAVELAASAPS